MFYEKRITHSPELPHDSPQARELAEMCFAYYRYVLALRNELPTERFHLVRYEQLVKDARPVVKSLYDWMGLPMIVAYREKLDGFAKKQREYQSTHEYSLEQFGLSRDWVYEQIPEVYEAFGYTR